MANTVLIVTVVVFALILILGITGLVLYLVLSKRKTPTTTGNTNPTGSSPPVVIIPGDQLPNPTGNVTPNPTGVVPPNPGGTNPTGNPSPEPLPPADSILPQTPMGTLSNSIYYYRSGSTTSYTTSGATKVPVYLFDNKQIYNYQRGLYMVVVPTGITYSATRPSYGWSYDGSYVTSQMVKSNASLGLSVTADPTGDIIYYIGYSKTKFLFDGYRFILCTVLPVNGVDYIKQDPALTIQGIGQITGADRVLLMTENLANIGQPLTLNTVDVWTVVD